MRKLDFQNRASASGTCVVIAEIARFAWRVVKIAEAMPLDVHDQPPSESLSPPCCIPVQDPSAGVGRPPVTRHFVENRPCGFGTSLADYKGCACIAFVAVPHEPKDRRRK